MNRVNIPQIFGDYTLLPSYSRFQHLGLTDERPSLAHRHIALWFYAKLTPLVLLHCQLTHAPWKWFFLQQPASLPALEGHLSPLLSWKRQREKVDWLEKNNRESWGSYQGEREEVCRLTVDQRAPPAGTPAHEAGRAEPSAPPGRRSSTLEMKPSSITPSTLKFSNQLTVKFG